MPSALPPPPGFMHHRHLCPRLGQLVGFLIMWHFVVPIHMTPLTIATRPTNLKWLAIASPAQRSAQSCEAVSNRFAFRVALGKHPITAGAYRFLGLPPWEAAGRFCLVLPLATAGLLFDFFLLLLVFFFFFSSVLLLQRPAQHNQH